MIEQQVADRFQEAVADEPPLGFDPDDVIDRAIKRGRRRKVVWAVAAATVVEAVVVWAVAATPGADTSQTAAARPAPAPAPVVQPPSPTFELTGFERTLTLDNPTDLRPAGSELMFKDLRVRNPDGDSGTLRLKKGNDVAFEISLANFRDYDMHYVEPVTAAAGVPVTLTVDCTASLHGCGGVSLTITGTTVVKVR